MLNCLYPGNRCLLEEKNGLPHFDVKKSGLKQVRVAKRLGGQKSGVAKSQGGKMSGKMSGWHYVCVAKCWDAKMSKWQNVLVAKCWSGKMSAAKMLFAKMFVTKMLVYL